MICGTRVNFACYSITIPFNRYIKEKQKPEIYKINVIVIILHSYFILNIFASFQPDNYLCPRKSHLHERICFQENSCKSTGEIGFSVKIKFILERWEGHFKKCIFREKKYKKQLITDEGGKLSLLYTSHSRYNGLQVIDKGYEDLRWGPNKSS